MLKAKKESPVTVREQKMFSRRGFVLKTIAGLPFAALGLRLMDLQIFNGEYYADLSKGNRIRIFSTEAPRGLIHDRNGIVLAKNIPSYDLIIVPEDCPDLDETLRKVSRNLEIRFESMKRNVVENRTAKFIPITIAKDLNWRQLSVVSAYREEFPGIGVEFTSVRQFLYGEQNAHALGYMGKVNEEQQAQFKKGRSRSSRVLGQEGLEYEFNSSLVGFDGGEQSEVDSQGRVIKVFDSIPPVPGRSLNLTLDNRVQSYVHENFLDRKGAVVITNPSNGEVISMVSHPSYDPNIFSKGVASADWAKLINNPDRVLNNRAIKGLYSPGSTFKILVALAGLSEGLISENTVFDCPGHYRLGNRTFRCWKRSGHGPVDLTSAIEQSCNVFFYRLGKELGVERIHKYASQFGFGKKTGQILSGEVSGLAPDPAWKLRTFGVPWQQGETIIYSIGQGSLSVTPIQLSTCLNTILNDGVMHRPRFVRNVSDLSDEAKSYLQSQGIGFNATDLDSKKKNLNLNPDYRRIVTEGMRRVVQGSRGTARSSNSPLISLAGKTGTTQVISEKTRKKLAGENAEIDTKYLDHAWFMGFAPAKNPKVSIVVLLENGEKGSNAAKFARNVLEFYSREVDSLAEASV